MVMQTRETHRVEHIQEEAQKHQLDYLDLLHATLCIEAKYRGEFVQEKFYAESIVNPSEQLWHEAYYCALVLKKSKMEIWPYHIPRLKDLGLDEPSDEDFGGVNYAEWNNRVNNEKEADLLAARYNYFN